jgi:hypothetical protein
MVKRCYITQLDIHRIISPRPKFKPRDSDLKMGTFGISISSSDANSPNPNPV